MRQFLGSEFTAAEKEKAAFHIIPAPMELSVSYGGGAARGPEAILEASDQLEAFDRGAFPGKDAVYTREAVEPVDPSAPVSWVAAIRDAVAEALACGAKPLVLGGEHTVTLGAVQAFVAAGEPFGIVHFDAHADLRNEYEGTPYSHACVLRRCHELGVPLAQFGTRAYSAEEHEYREANRATLFAADAEDLALAGPPRPILPKAFPKRVYVTFDVDAWEPAVMPATGTPVPGGLLWYSAAFILKEIAQSREIIGADVVELAPIPGLNHPDFTAARMCQLLMGLMEKTPAQTAKPGKAISLAPKPAAAAPAAGAKRGLVVIKKGTVGHRPGCSCGKDHASHD